MGARELGLAPFQVRDRASVMRHDLRASVGHPLREADSSLGCLLHLVEPAHQQRGEANHREVGRLDLSEAVLAAHLHAFAEVLVSRDDTPGAVVCIPQAAQRPQLQLDGA
jgi:hypothetical protein